MTRLFGQGTPVSRRLFGDHKSWRGLVIGTASGFLLFVAQRSLADRIPLVDYSHVPLAAGILMSAGALLGDLIRSFFKRLRRLPPGATWIPFDQVDYIAGAVIATRFVVALTAQQMIIAVLAYVALHMLVSAIGYALHLKERLI